MNKNKSNDDDTNGLMLDYKINQILNKFDSSNLIISMAYEDRGTEFLNQRLYRAAINQLDQPAGEAMASRYGIWANTVRDHIIDGLVLLNKGNSDGARDLLIRAANSLSAFSEIQALADPLRLGKSRDFMPAGSFNSTD
jgi:hypothetical protein